MFFTREDILKIQQALLQLGVKDSELPSAEPVTYDDTLSIVQDGKNKQIGVKDFFNQISLWKREDFLNITDKYDEHYISLREAINLVSVLQRKDGLVITFQDVEGNWEIYQFRGNITEFLNEEKWFDLYDYRNYIVQSVVPDEEDLTASTPDENGNSLVSLKDRVYDESNFSGKGYKILRKNIIEINNEDSNKVRKNILTQDMINEPNTIYEIRYDFDLNNNLINVPENCTLMFTGGSLNNGTINGNDTDIINEKILCRYSGTFKKDIINANKLQGNINNFKVIKNQKDFDNWILNRDTDNIIIDSELPLKVNNTINITKDTVIIGKKAVLEWDNTIYKLSDSISKNEKFYSCKLKENVEDFSALIINNKLLSFNESSDDNTKINLTSEKVQKIDNISFKLKIPNNLLYLNNKEFINCFGWLDSWYFCTPFKVQRSDDKYFYCTLYNSINDSDWDNKLNGEFGYNNSPISFVLYNAEYKNIQYNNENINISLNLPYVTVINNKNSNVIFNVSNCKLKLNSIVVKNASKGIFTDNSCIEVNNCEFENILGNCIYCNSSINNNIITNCNFKNCSIIPNSRVISDAGYAKAGKLIIKNNIINRYKDNYCVYKSASPCIIQGQQEFIVYNNTIINSVRDHIYVRQQNSEIYYNLIYNTESFNKYSLRNLSRDFGGIYVGYFAADNDTALNNTTTCYIHNNKILNIKGKGDARGIFIDDGRGDVTCKYNIVEGQAYSIDARDAFITACSCRVKYIGNILLSPYRLIYKTDVLTGDNVPKAQDNICVFNNEDENSNVQSTNNYYTDKIIKNDEYIYCSLDIKDKINSSIYSMLIFDKQSKYYVNPFYINISNYDNVTAIKILIENINFPISNKIQNVVYKITLNPIRFGSEFIDFYIGISRVENKYYIKFINGNENISTFSHFLVYARYNESESHLVLYLFNLFYISLNFDMFNINVNCIYTTIKNTKIKVLREQSSVAINTINSNNDYQRYIINPRVSYNNSTDNYITYLNNLISKYPTLNFNDISVTSINGDIIKYNNNKIECYYKNITNTYNSISKLKHLVKGQIAYCTDIKAPESSVSGVIIYYLGNNNWADSLGRIINNKYSIITNGTSNNRPVLTEQDEGFEYYDSTLKKKILWNGTTWVNFDGTIL